MDLKTKIRCFDFGKQLRTKRSVFIFVSIFTYPCTSVQKLNRQVSGMLVFMLKVVGILMCKCGLLVKSIWQIPSVILDSQILKKFYVFFGAVTGQNNGRKKNET